MCGIIGVIGADDWWEYDKFLRDALVVDTVRGPHSTGMFWVSQEDELSYYKQAVTGAEVAFSEGFKQTFSVNAKKDRPKFVCGHNRWATRGEVTQENAHPFHHGDICGVHNGTLDTYAGLSAPETFIGTGKKKRKASVAETFGTDSETIFYTLSDTADYKEVLKALDGAFTLIWHDLEDNCVRMVRNTKRPLYVAKLRTYDTLVYASEKEMLEFLISRRRASIEKIESLPPEEVWRFDLSRKDGKDRIKPHIQKVELKKSWAQGAGWSQGNYYGSGYYGRSNNSQSNTGSTTNRGNLALVNSGRETVGEIMRGANIDRNADVVAEITGGELFRSNSFRLDGVTIQGTRELAVACYLNPPILAGQDTSTLDTLYNDAKYIMGKALSTTKAGSEVGILLGWQGVTLFDKDWGVLLSPLSRKDSVTEDEKAALEARFNKAQNLQTLRKLEKESEDSDGDTDEGDPDDPLTQVRAVPTLRGPRGIYISKEEWREKTQDGCCYCTGTIWETEAELVTWVDDASPVCTHCQDLVHSGHVKMH